MMDASGVSKDFAAWLARQAWWPAAAVAAIFAAAPLAALAAGLLPHGGLAAMLVTVAVLSGLAALGLSALVRLDAALFHLMASHGGEAGGAAVDDALARMKLKARPERTRSLAERMAGARRLVDRQRLAFGIFAATVAIVPIAALS